MPSIEMIKVINSPAQRVFETVAHLGEFAQAVPTITTAECLTDQETGAGSQWRIYRDIGGRERSTVFEVLEYEPAEWVRIVSEAGGATWDAGFEVAAKGKGKSGSELIWTLDATPNSLKARVGLPLLMGTIEKALAPDLDAVKRYCESAT
ncbi:MAG: SRPBCC family protein [Candidatus Phaeomarinobacter sp.]